MARRRYKRAASALTQLSKSKQQAKFRDIEAQGIRAGTEAKVARMNKAFDLAGQALVTADALAQEYKTKGKIEKGVTSLAEAKGGDVSYKKTGLKDIFSGEAKLSDWGKESWDVGGTKYDRADVLAWHQKGQKDLKWEGIIGKQVTKYDKDTGGVSKERVKTPSVEKKDYKIQGEAELFNIEGMEKKHGKGWSYGKQKAIGKMSTAQKAGLPDDAAGILKSQVAANVGNPNFNRIIKAYETEFAGHSGYDKSDVKALKLKNQMWNKAESDKSAKSSTGHYDDDSSVLKRKQMTNRLKTGKDINAIEGVIASAKSMQETKIGKKFTDDDYKGTDSSLDAIKNTLTSGTQKLSEATSGALGAIDKVTSGDIDVPKPKKDYWGKRRGVDVWENFKDKRAEAQEQKAIASTKDEIQSIISGDDFVSPDELAKNDLQDKRREEIVKSLDSIDYNAPSMDKDSDFVDASGQTLQEYEGSLPEFKNMGGVMRSEGYSKGGWTPNSQSPGAKKKDSIGFTGSSEQNIELMNTIVRDKFTERSSLSADWDFNKAQAGDYDSSGMVFGEPKESGENKGQYTTYDEGGEVITGLHEGKNYYPPVELKGQNLRKMWDTLGVGDWDDRDTLWNQYMADR